MGKSRLAAEGIRLAYRNKLTGYAGACKSDGVHTPYLVWNTVWNAIFDLDPAMPIRKQIRSMELELEDWAPENLDALPLLGSVLGVPLPENDFTSALQPKDRKSQLEALLVKRLEFSAREAAEDGGGLLLALEDLHWIDPVSSDLLEVFAHAIENLPVLILLTYRPLDAVNAHPSVERVKAMRHYTEIKLTDLNAAESEQIIRGKLAQLFPEQRGGVSHLLIERITHRAQGNPFYVEELLNYLHDTGVNLRDVKAWSSLELPSSLHSLILSRIDQLTPSQQLSLKVASIIGRAFRFDHLCDYYPSLGNIEQVKTDLQAMNRLDLTILETPEPELTYIFKHLVTHEVGYESIAYATRAKLHGQYAHYLEDSHPDQVDSLAPQLALHFEKAQIQDKARHYLIKAGEQAAANFANDEALSYFNRALALAPDTSSRFYFDTLLKRERVYDLLGRRTEQRRDLGELGRLADKFEDASHLDAQIAIRQAKLDIDEGDNLAARASARSAIEELASLPGQASDLLVDALLLDARAMFLSGQAIASRPQLDDALAQARAHQYLRGEYNALAQLGLWHWYNGDNASAAALLEQSLELIRQGGDVRRELEILNNLGIVKKDMYQFGDALAHYEKAQKIARKIGDRSGESSLLNNMGRASIVSGDFANALLYCSRAELLAAEVNDPNVQGIAMHNISEAYRELGLYVPGRKAAEESLQLLRAATYRVGEAYTLENHALIEFALGERERALKLAEEALAIAREIGAKRLEVSVLTRIGLMKLQMDEIASAEKVFLSAKEIEEEYKEALPMFELQMGLAEVALARGAASALTSAGAAVAELASQVLQDPPADQAHVIPMWLYRTCIRVLRATADPQTESLIRRVRAELLARCEKISDPSMHEGFLGIPENRAILEFAANLPGSE
jgi:tetratricopeptide (TPR) repeat protein